MTEHEENGPILSFKIFLVMYADDTLLISDTKKGLQTLLMQYETYCENNRLNINIDKTKIMVIGKNYSKPKFYIKEELVEVVNSYKYLGVTFTKTGRYIKTMKENIDKARKAFYAMLRKARENSIPIDCQIEFFRKTVEPVLLYGSEIWGYENLDSMEKFRLKCLKIILKLKTNTPHYMIYGELGLLPLDVDIKTRMISFWGRLMTGNKRKLAYILYKSLKDETSEEDRFSKWINHVKKILQNTGYNYFWLYQENLLTNFPKTELKQRLRDQHEQIIRSMDDFSHKKKNYLLLKKVWKPEQYLSNLDSVLAHSLLKYRTSNHSLPVETGRHFNVQYNERICLLCKDDVGDEYHYLLKCSALDELRNKMLPKYIVTKPSMYKYIHFLQTAKGNKLRKLASFTASIMKTIK